ncbi:BON domain-containing protein [Adhaeretor mobilis]|uniref:BON domain protein n=1 Tax=Adhaeretor mobilis TaxID=1930276 RepID=A0A517MZE7_9BACT|nr:BON domain protein [Adhaeretor mobilis]
MIAQSSQTKIAVEPNVPASPVEDRCLISEVLRRNGHHGLIDVNCDLREGMAILHGRVSRYYLKQMAQEIAKHSNGVEAVVNRIQVCSA